MAGTIRLLCLAFLAGTTIAIDCYTPGGVSRNAQMNVSALYYYAPCQPTAKHSMCCAWGAGRAPSANKCLENGLCADSDGVTIWRESCTDPTWKDPACVKLFVNGTGYDNTAVIYDPDAATQVAITDVRVRQCDDGSFCYGSDNRACCAQKQGVFVNSQGEQVSTQSAASSTSSISGSSSPSTSSTTGSAQSSSSTADASSNESDGLSTAAKIGIGVGVSALALIIAICLGFWLVRRRKQKKQQTVTPAHDPKRQSLLMEKDSSDRVPPYSSPTWQQPQEMDTHRPRTHTQTDPIEMG